jgi:hypothetical protein
VARFSFDVIDYDSIVSVISLPTVLHDKLFLSFVSSSCFGDVLLLLCWLLSYGASAASYGGNLIRGFFSLKSGAFKAC